MQTLKGASPLRGFAVWYGKAKRTQGGGSAYTRLMFLDFEHLNYNSRKWLNQPLNVFLAEKIFGKV